MTTTEKTTSVGPISIKPFITNRENMGLEKYGMVVMPGTFQEEQLACTEINGVIRYITGLDEFSPNVKNISDENIRKAVIKEIRETVALLELELASNSVDPKDKDFWNKVKLLRPDNIDFWSKISIRCGNEPVFLDPKNPHDLIKIKAIEAGGFSLIAKSYEDAKNSSLPPKFFLDKHIETVSTKIQFKKLRNKALSILDDLYRNNPNKLFYVCKVVDSNSVQYKKNTPIDIMYENMDNFINGEGVEKNKIRATEAFINASELDMETLILKSIVKDASFYKEIAPKADGMLYHMKTVTVLGRNVADVIEYLRNPLNEEILTTIKDKIEKYWNE